jgi:hypothetical protein
VIIKFKDILPNPNRDLKFNPLDPVKVSALEASINSTGFWDNVVVRRCPTQPSKFEQAYGHQRVQAAKNAGLKQADFIVKELSDEDMIKIMALENDDAYRYSILSLLEKVKAVVIGLAEGRVKPFKIGEKTKDSSIIYAPSYTPGGSSSKLLDHRYTTANVAQFLGMFSVRKEDKAVVPDNKVIAALGALRLMQSGHMTESSIRDLKVNRLLEQVRSLEQRKEVSKEREKEKARQEEEKRKSEVQKAAEAKAEAVKRQKELDAIIAKERHEYAAKQKAIIAAEKEEAQAKADAAKALAAEMKAEWDAGEAERKKAKLAAERAAVAETARKEGRRASHVKSIVEKVERVLVDDSLYELLRDLKKTTALTPAERKNLKTALQDAGVRFREHASKF